MSIKLIIDSASDISPEEAKELGLEFVPLKISFEDKDYLDGNTLSKVEFYRKLKTANKLPKTSQVTPYDFEQSMGKLISEGHTVIVITLSSTLSGTYSSAQIAASNYPDDKVYVVDSMNASIGEGLLVKYALDLVAQGLDAVEIVKLLEEKKKNIKLMFLMDSLDSLYKGGRLSKIEAMTGSILSIKPILSLEDGKIVLAGKARGSKKAAAAHVDLAVKQGEIDLSMPHCLAYSGEDKPSEHSLKAYETLFTKPIDQVDVTMMGCTIGTHVGFGAIGIAFFAK